MTDSVADVEASLPASELSGLLLHPQMQANIDIHNIIDNNLRIFLILQICNYITQIIS